MFSVRHRSAVINWRFCPMRRAFRPRACRRLPANSISAKRPSSCRRTILRTRVGYASSHLGWKLDFAGHPSVGTACALVMQQHVRPSDPMRLILEENVGPLTVDVAQRNGGFHGTLTLSRKIEGPSGAPSPTDLAAVLSIEPAAVRQVFFAGVGVPLCFAQLNSNEAVDRAAINRAAWAATLSRAWSPHIFFFAGNLQDGGRLYARMWAPALGVEEDAATGGACAALVGAMASKPDFGGTAYRLSIEQGVSMGRRSEIEAEARKSDSVVTSVSVGGTTAYIASGEIDVPPSALVSQTVEGAHMRVSRRQ